MTTQNTPENPATGFEIDALLKQHVATINLKISEHLTEYAAAKQEIANAEENRQRSLSSVEVSKNLANGINEEIRSSLRERIVDARALHKKRAARAGYLEDVEIYNSIANEAELSKATSKLRAGREAGEVVGLRRQASLAALNMLSEYITGHLNDEFRAISLYFHLLCDIAGRGDSSLYDADPSVRSAAEFSIRELSKIIKVGLGAHDLSLGSAVFLEEIPPELPSSVISPFTAARLESEISAAKETL